MGIPEALPYIQFVGQIALIAAATFAGFQFLMHRQERADHRALQVLTQLQSAEFRTAYAKLWALPLEASPAQVEAEGPEMAEAIDCVMMTFESLGVMVHNRIVPIDVVDQVIGGFLRESWRRTHRYIQAQRDLHRARRLGEWYQWLAEHLAVEERRSRGAYEAFKDWEP